ncbi:amidohydrolase family protein [Anaerofilum sp. BX8]|uniref:Amidohydrolase family protein n=1 Tax=Anaerofilum hominis TaxID=2763016 RepID=A0A923I7Z5_9FIRM|nr:amidohydrolase family protein [Anaerofilum hominis]MBC5580466.1 amidohydrolase family protein [Anaerofilum hominis]
MYVIKGRVIDGNGGAPIEKGAVVVEGDRILEVCEEKALQVPPDAQILEVADGTVMPGLIDLHTHIGGVGKLFTMSPHEATARALPKLKEILYSGFTTIRECGGIGVHIRSCQEEGVFESPRINSAGMGVFQTGGHGDALNGMIMPTGIPKNLLTTWGLCADGEAEVRQQCRYTLSQGADFIKIATSSGVNSRCKTVNKVEFSDSEVKAAVEEAEHFGTYVSSHAVSNGGIKLAARNGVRTIEHATFLDEEAVELIEKAGAYIIPTFALAKVQYDMRDRLDPLVGKKIAVAYEAHCRTFELAFKANLKIGVGTDFFPGPDNALEMEFLAGLGMDPMAVIQAATKTGAEVLMRNDIGTLDKGKLADIILVSGNPLKNMGLLRRTENVKVVMQGGKIVKQL